MSFYADLRRAWDASQRSFDRKQVKANLKLALRGLWSPPPVVEPTGTELLRFAATHAPGSREAQEAAT